MIFGEIADALEGGFVADGVVEDVSLGVGGADDGGHDFDEGGLAGAVGSEQAEDLAAVDLHVDAAQGVDFAFVDFGDVAEVDCEVGGAHVKRITVKRENVKREASKFFQGSQTKMTRFTSSRLHVSMKIPRSELIPGQQVREIVQFPRHHVYDLALTLDVSFGLQQCGMPRRQTALV